MAKTPNIPQKFGSVGNNLLYESLYQVQRALQQASLQGRKNGTTVQASTTLTIDNTVVRVVGSATVNTIKAGGFGMPIFLYAQDGFEFTSKGGNVRTDAVLGAGDSAIAQYDSVKDEWFIVGGGGPPISGFVTDGSNVGGGAEVFKAKAGSILEHRTLLATGGITLTQNANDVTIGSAGVSVGSKQIAYGDGAGNITSEPGFEYDPATNVQTVDEIRFKRPYVNVKFPWPTVGGAKGDGATDDTDSIQAAIDYAETLGGATVFFPAGTYIIGKTAGTGLIAGDNVSYLGEEKGTTIIEWKPVSGGSPVDVGGVMLNTTGKDVYAQTIASLTFWKNNTTVPTAAVTGVLGGSNTVGEYNSGTVTFRDLRLVYLEYGIRGNGRGYDTVGNAKVGIFDSVFDNIGYYECKYGVHTGGSGNLHIKPFFILCTGAGLVMDYISAESTSGETFIAGTFTQNKYDIYFYDGGAGAFETYRNTGFYGTWFESSTHGIIGYDATIGGPVLIPCLNFQGCVLQTNVAAPTGYLLDGTKITGRLNVNECVAYKNLVAHDDSILGGAGTILSIRDSIKFGTSGWVAPNYIGTDASLHATKDAAQVIAASGGTIVTWDLLGAGAFDTESCFDNVNDQYVARYAGRYNVEARVLIEADAAGGVDVRIIQNDLVPASRKVIAITHHPFVGAGDIHHMVVTGNVNCVVGDTIGVSVYNPATNITVIINVFAFNQAHYNTFSVTREF